MMNDGQIKTIIRPFCRFCPLCLFLAFQLLRILDSVVLVVSQSAPWREVVSQMSLELRLISIAD